MAKNKMVVTNGVYMDSLDLSNLRYSYDYGNDIMYCYMLNAPWFLKGICTDGSTIESAKKKFLSIMEKRTNSIRKGVRK